MSPVSFFLKRLLPPPSTQGTRTPRLSMVADDLKAYQTFRPPTSAFVVTNFIETLTVAKKKENLIPKSKW